MTPDLQQQFGRIDIYVFDQILRGNIAPGMRVLDAGCGDGRNLIYLMREGCELYGVDQHPEAVGEVRRLASALAPSLPAENFRLEAIERMSFTNDFADVVICSSVLHFVRGEAHFHAMIAELWRVLRPGGMLFCRLGSRIGMDFERVTGNIYRIGDGSEWFLVDESMLMELTSSLGATLVDPLKTTIVQGHRCMTTWVIRKSI